jgi:Tfp pilus assembly protein PilV
MIRSMTARSWVPRDDSRSADTPLKSRAAAALCGDDGFSLAEVIVAMSLFVIVSISSLIALTTLVKVTSNTQNRVAASNLARQEVERLRGENSTSSQLDAAAITQASVHGTTYTITPTMNPVSTVMCNPGSSRQVTVVVAWNSSGSRSVRYDTVLSC